MVFMSRTSGADIWSLPIDADRAKLRGPLTRITQDVAEDYDPGCRRMAGLSCSAHDGPETSTSSRRT